MCNEAVYTGGDLNARLQYKYASESEVMGPHIFGRGRTYLYIRFSTGNQGKQGPVRGFLDCQFLTHS